MILEMDEMAKVKPQTISPHRSQNSVADLGDVCLPMIYYDDVLCIGMTSPHAGSDWQNVPRPKIVMQCIFSGCESGCRKHESMFKKYH